jgi:hypothetical protein
MTSPGWTETTISGVDYYQMPAVLRVPVNFDPSSNVFVAVAAPGASANFPAAVQGPPGPIQTITTVTLTALAYNDPTAASATLTPLSSTTAQLALKLHEGAPGANGTTTLQMSTYGTPLGGDVLVVDPTATTFVYQPQKIPARYQPATIQAVPGGVTNFTLATVSVPALPYDWRPRCHGYCIITGTGPNQQTDLLVRLNDQNAGNIVARATSLAGQTPAPHVLSPGTVPGAADTFDRILAGNAATLYFRTERQSGTDYYTTSAATSQFDVETLPI